MEDTRKRNQEIKDRYENGGITYQKLSAEYGVSRQRIQQIVCRELREPVDRKTGRKIKVPDRRIRDIEKLGLAAPKFSFQKYGIDTVFASDYLKKRVIDNAILNPLFDIIKRINITAISGKKFSGGRDRFRFLIRLRDGNMCQWCGRKWNEGERALDVHHIDGTPEDTMSCGGNHLMMVTLCHRCHLNIDSGKMRKTARLQG